MSPPSTTSRSPRKEVSDQTRTFVQQAGSLQSLQQQAAESVGVSAAQLPALIRVTVLQQKLSDALAREPAGDAGAAAGGVPEGHRPVRPAGRRADRRVEQDARPNRSCAQVKRNPASFAALAAQVLPGHHDEGQRRRGRASSDAARSSRCSAAAAKAKAGQHRARASLTANGVVVLHIISRQISRWPRSSRPGEGVVVRRARRPAC